MKPGRHLIAAIDLDVTHGLGGPAALCIRWDSGETTWVACTPEKVLALFNICANCRPCPMFGATFYGCRMEDAFALA